MVLATAILLLQFPLAITPANAANRPIRATRVGSAAITAPAAPASATNNAARPVATAPTKLPASAQPSRPASKDENASAAQPFAPTDGYAPAEPIIHSFQPPTGSIAQLTGPSFSDAILPPPPFRPPLELPATHRRLWLALSTAEHSAAAYDAWSTRRALAAGRIEADPLMRPFAGSIALYPAIQLVPLGLDYLAHRLQHSSGWTHRIWWLPQSAATVTFLFSGSYNVAHTN